MTKEKEKYTTLDTKQCKWWVITLFGMAKSLACRTNNFDDAKEIQSAQDKIIKALEQQPNDETIKYLECNDIDAQEFIKAMKKQPLQVIKPNICDDCVSRQAVKDGMIKYGFHAPDMTVTEFIEDELPPVKPTHGTCKDCKYSSVHTISLDKIDEIRVCRIRFCEQIKDDYYCADYERRE